MASTSPVIWTLFVGPFVGACLAFALARVYDANRRFKERLATANLALLTLKNQYNDFVMFRRSFKEDCHRLGLTGAEPVWMLIRPSFMNYGEYEFDYEGVAFLFEGGAFVTAFDAIEEAQIMHRSLIKMDEQRTTTARETQRMVAEAAKGASVDVTQAENILGKALVAELDMLCVGLAARAEDEQIYLKAFRALRVAVRDSILKTWTYRLGYLYRFRHDATVEQLLVQIKERLNVGFNLDELPTWPNELQSRLNELRATRSNLNTAAG